MTLFIYESWNNIALTKGGQNSPIYKGWKPCKLSMVFTPDCSQLFFDKYYRQTKCLPDKTISLTAYLISIGLDRPIPLSTDKISYKRNIWYRKHCGLHKLQCTLSMWYKNLPAFESSHLWYTLICTIVRRFPSKSQSATQLEWFWGIIRCRSRIKPRSSCPSVDLSSHRCYMFSAKFDMYAKIDLGCIVALTSLFIL